MILATLEPDEINGSVDFGIEAARVYVLSGERAPPRRKANGKQYFNASYLVIF